MKRLKRLLAIVVIALGTIYVCAFVLLRSPSMSSDPYALAQRADAETLRRHVEYLVDAGPRHSKHPEVLGRVAHYIESQFIDVGLDTELQSFEVEGATYYNVIARLGPEGPPSWVIGAHYDAFGMFEELPGADDNASGTAGLIELAKLLASEELRQPVELVAYSLEEPPFFASPWMGSRIHADRLAEAGTALQGMICLEMIGYFSEHQPWSSIVLEWLYPDHGQFIGVVGRRADRRLVAKVKRAMKGASSLPVYSFVGPRIMGIDASDHRNYWHHDYTAVMVSDTAFLRNPHYHQATDLPSTLDYPRMAQVVDGVANAVVSLVN